MLQHTTLLFCILHVMSAHFTCLGSKENCVIYSKNMKSAKLWTTFPSLSWNSWSNPMIRKMEVQKEIETERMTEWISAVCSWINFLSHEKVSVKNVINYFTLDCNGKHSLNVRDVTIVYAVRSWRWAPMPRSPLGVHKIHHPHFTHV